MSARHKRPKEPRQVRVADPEGLSCELRRVIQEVYGGVSNAAEKIGMPQSTLHRIVSGRRTALRLSTVRRLKRLVPEGRQSHFDEMLLSRAAINLLAAYKKWQGDRFHRYLFNKRAWWSIVGGKAQKTAGNHRTVPAQRTYLLTRLVERAGVECAKEFEKLLEDFELGGHDGGRENVAYLRIVEPLLDAPDCGRIELSEHELSKADFRRFISAGIKRERILLKRSANAVRAWELANGKGKDEPLARLGSIGPSPTRKQFPWHE
jgi:hypothetical protein